jgi:hypothetical protein
MPAYDPALSREYFERGCLCILQGTLERLSPEVDDEVAKTFYENHCACSRNYMDLME